MLIQVLKSKIHRARVTEARLDYEGSVTIDAQIMRRAGLLPYEKVQVMSFETGVRFETYALVGKPDSGTICLNGPAARLGKVGDEIIILSFAALTPKEAGKMKPKLVFLDSKNRMRK